MNVGDALPLYLQLADKTTGKFVRATVRDKNNSALTGSPVTLAGITGGLYGADSIAFPSGAPWVWAQYEVFDDAGFTTPTAGEGADLDVFFYTGGQAITNPIPCLVQLADKQITKYVRCTVRDSSNSLVGTVHCVHIADGAYGDTSLTFPTGQPWVSCEFEVFTDAGFTSPDSSEGSFTRIVFAPPIYSQGGGGGGSSSASPTVIKGIVDPIGGLTTGIIDSVVRGEDRLLTVRFIQASNEEPFALGSASEIEFRFPGESSTVISKKYSQSQVTIISSDAGKVTVQLAGADTANLLAASPAPFECKITQPGGVSVVQFRTQLAVLEALT